MREDLAEVGGRYEDRRVELDEDHGTGNAVPGVELLAITARGVHGAAVFEGGLAQVQVCVVRATSVPALDSNSVRASIPAPGPHSGGAELVVNSTAIESALGELRDLPAPISSRHVEARPDVRDDPAVWVWAMLEPDAVDAGTQSQLRNIVSDLVHRETGATCCNYVRFPGASETA